MDGLAKLNVKWGCETRVDFVDKDLLRRMKDAGCVLIRYGIESFNQKSLDLLGKKLDVTKMLNNLELTFDIGIREVRCSFMIGIPGENPEDIENTFKWCRKFPTMKARFWALHPVPGTYLYENMQKYGIGFQERIFQTDHSNIFTGQLSNQEINTLITQAHNEFGNPLEFSHSDFSSIILRDENGNISRGLAGILQG
ncbi:MAG: radical SAM protein [Oligoflexia bacterium]|nr:radical SAM protein [Oligoflexia bacterium]